VNEDYYKGGQAEPAAYGALFMSLYDAVKANGLSDKTLLFNMFGDYSMPDGNWSQDANNGGWLRDAVKATPDLPAALSQEAMSTHNYGPIGQNHADESGTDAVAAQEALAKTVIGTVPPFYITEWGIDMVDQNLATHCGADRQQGQAYDMTAGYNAFLADPNVRGIWWYSAHDDGTGQWGLFNNDNTTRPSFNALVKSLDLKQHTPSCTP
jgi:hypothetical protein